MVALLVGVEFDVNGQVGGPGCFEKGLILMWGVDVVGGVVLVVAFVEEEDGFGSGVVNPCMKGCLGGVVVTSWMDFCSAMT